MTILRRIVNLPQKAKPRTCGLAIAINQAWKIASDMPFTGRTEDLHRPVRHGNDWKRQSGFSLGTGSPDVGSSRCDCLASLHARGDEGHNYGAKTCSYRGNKHQRRKLIVKTVREKQPACVGRSFQSEVAHRN